MRSRCMVGMRAHSGVSARDNGPTCAMVVTPARTAIIESHAARIASTDQPNRAVARNMADTKQKAAMPVRPLRHAPVQPKKKMRPCASGNNNRSAMNNSFIDTDSRLNGTCSQHNPRKHATKYDTHQLNAPLTPEHCWHECELKIVRFVARLISPSVCLSTIELCSLHRRTFIQTLFEFLSCEEIGLRQTWAIQRGPVVHLRSDERG